MSKKQNRWTTEELKILEGCFDKDMNYEQVSELLPNKSAKEVKSKVETKKWSSHFRRKDCWSKEELDLLKHIYPNVKNEELEKHFPNKTKICICTKANRMGLKKAYDVNRIENIKQSQKSNISYWNCSKKEELIDIYNKNGEEYCYSYFREKYNNTREYIKKKLIEYGLIDFKNKIKNPNLNDVFNYYKHNNSFKYLNGVTKQQLVMIFRYYAKKNNLLYKDYYLNNQASDILTKASVQALVKQKYGDYYLFFCDCFPNFNFKRWEFKILDVPNGYWNNKNNCYCHIREMLKRFKKDNIIKEDWEILALPVCVLTDNGFNASLLYFKGKGIIQDYLNKINVHIPKEKLPIFNNVKFDSFEEREVYRFIYENITNKITKVKRSNKYFNAKENENYIPDFEINLGNKKIIIEYFGLYQRGIERIAQGYSEKTIRKEKYYKSLDDVIFIGIYPNDIKDNFKGVREKFDTLLLYKKIRERM